MFGTLRRAICEPGRNASTPMMSTVTPPLILRVSTPSTGSSASWASRILLPHPQEVGLLLGEHDDAVVVLQALEKNLDLLAGLDGVAVLELVQGHGPFTLEAEFQDDHAVGHPQDLRVDDLSLAEVAHRVGVLREQASKSAVETSSFSSP